MVDSGSFCDFWLILVCCWRSSLSSYFKAALTASSSSGFYSIVSVFFCATFRALSSSISISLHSYLYTIDFFLIRFRHSSATRSSTPSLSYFLSGDSTFSIYATSVSFSGLAMIGGSFGPSTSCGGSSVHTFLLLGWITSVLGLLAFLRFAPEAFSFIFLALSLDFDDFDAFDAFETSFSLPADNSGCKSDYWDSLIAFFDATLAFLFFCFFSGCLLISYLHNSYSSDFV